MTSKEVKSRYRIKNRESLREKGRTYYHHNPRKHKNNSLKRRYGITIEQYDEMVSNQHDLCAICKKPEKAIHHSSNQIKPLSVDHNHTTGQVRGLLCFKCNYVVGLVESSKDRLKSFISYLENWDK